jgi:hypothetical protein
LIRDGDILAELLPVITKTSPNTDALDRYLAGLTSDSEAELIEEQVAKQPELVREIESRLRLREGLALLQDRGELKPLLRARVAALRIAVSIAASLLLLSLGVWLVHVITHSRPAVLLAQSLDELEQARTRSSPLPLGERYVLARSRGGDDVVAVVLPPAAAALELAAVPSFSPPAGRFDVSLLAEKDGAFVKIAGATRVPLNKSGYADVFIDSGALMPGTYELSVRSSDAKNDADPVEDRFTLRLQR